MHCRRRRRRHYALVNPITEFASSHESDRQSVSILTTYTYLLKKSYCDIASCVFSSVGPTGIKEGKLFIRTDVNCHS